MRSELIWVTDHLAIHRHFTQDLYAWVWGETTSIHVTRDVNTRSQHVFFKQFVREAGWVIDWSQIPGDVVAHARTLAIVEDHSGLDELIRPSLITAEDATRSDRLRAKLDEHVQGFTMYRMVRDPATLDRALDAAR